MREEDSSYSVSPKIDEKRELREFIKGLFGLYDSFIDKEKQLNKDVLETQLIEMKQYAEKYVGENSKLVKDIEIEIGNAGEDFTSKTDYYDDLLKLRAAISWEN